MQITHKRRAIQRTINWPVYHEQRAHLADLFAVIAYSGQAKRPLALGIKADLIGANTGLSEREVRHFLRAYTFGPRYLRALTVGAWRYDLDGAANGWVSPNEAEHAALSLKAHYADREWHRALKAAVAKGVQEPLQDSDWQPYPAGGPASIFASQPAAEPHSWCKFKRGDRVMNGTNERDQGTVERVQNDVNGPVYVNWDSADNGWCGADCLYVAPSEPSYPYRFAREAA